MKDDFDRLCAELAAAGEQVSDDEADSLIGEAAAEARELTRKARAAARSAREAGKPPATMSIGPSDQETVLPRR